MLRVARVLLKDTQHIWSKPSMKESSYYPPGRLGCSGPSTLSVPIQDPELCLQSDPTHSLSP